MRVMLDTNVLISALLFPSERMTKLFENLVVNHTVVLCSYVIDELHMVVERKFPNKADVVEKLLGRMSYELVYTPKTIDKAMLEIRDVKDYPVIYTAILEEVDVLVTGDRDFIYKKEEKRAKAAVLLLAAVWPFLPFIFLPRRRWGRTIR